jgi:hypothetical protein
LRAKRLPKESRHQERPMNPSDFIAWFERAEWWQIFLVIGALLLLWEVLIGMIRQLSRAIQGKDE